MLSFFFLVCWEDNALPPTEVHWATLQSFQEVNCWSHSSTWLAINIEYH